MTTARLLRAAIACHLSAAKILEGAIIDIEREEAQHRKRGTQMAQSMQRQVISGETGRSASKYLAHAESLYTINEVLTVLKISRTKLYNLIAERTLPIVKIGRATRVRRADLDRLIHGDNG